MTDHPTPSPSRRPVWRWLPWIGAATLLSLPAVVMAVGAEGVDWSPFDFIVMGVLLFGAAGALELALSTSGHWAYRLAAAGTVGGALLMTWADLAVGLLGPEGGLANKLLLLVPLTGLVGAAIARLRAGGMAWTTLAMAVVQLLVATVALTEPPTEKGLGWPWHIPMVTAVFTAGWLLAAGLFHRAASATSRLG